MRKSKYIKRDVSWLSFNHRVLQEAQDPTVPLYERIKFLAIYSSNLDEFFRVRVSSLRNLKVLKKEAKEAIEVKPKKELKDILEIVQQQQDEFGRTYRGQILPALQEAGIHLILNPLEYSPAQQDFVKTYFNTEIKALLTPHFVENENDIPFLENKGLYLAIQFNDSAELGIVNIPTHALPRFINLPTENDLHYVTFLDDIIKYNLPEFLDRKVDQAYSIKVSRDAEMYFEEEYEFPKELIERIKRAIGQRNEGLPTRFLYDNKMPQSMLNQMKRIFSLDKADVIPGARYHNFNDFFGFPDPTNSETLHDTPLPPLVHPRLEGAKTILSVISEKDQMLHFPYQKYEYVPQMIREAADDPTTTTIKITLYRVASKSAVVEALLYALRKGKQVMAFIEAKARFDEASNIFWGEALEKANAKVAYSFPNIKVHTKLLLIERQLEEGPHRHAYIGTGNFNEKTAKLYCDHALLTTHQQICAEVNEVFEFLNRQISIPNCPNLLVSPFTLRKKFIAMIDREIELAKAGKKAYMRLKMNSLEDKKMVKKLYEASQAGVKIQLIVRGICALVPGVEGMSENIEAISIVDRFLEHARVYIFGNDGDEKMFIASADWMTRNLDRRIEVGVPILDPDIYQQLKTIIDIQWADNSKARIIDANQSNLYRESTNSNNPVRAQINTYKMLQDLLVQPFPTQKENKA